MKDWNLPAPRFARYRVEYVPGKGHAVFDPDGNQTHRGLTASHAHQVCEELQMAWNAVRKIGPRACLCCGTTFVSEGIHHRMCSDCRGLADPLAGYGMVGVQDGRKSSGVRRAS